MGYDALSMSTAFAQLALLLSNRNRENHNRHCGLMTGDALGRRAYRNLNIKRSLMTDLLITTSAHLAQQEVYLCPNYPDKKHVSPVPKRTSAAPQ